MSQQIDDQPSRHTADPAPAWAHFAPRPVDLTSLTVRGLVAALGDAEDALRGLEPFIVQRGRLVVNPARGPWIARERALVAELRSRHSSWRRGVLPGPAGSAGPD